MIITILYYPINSYVLYTHPNGRSINYALYIYQVMNRLNDIYSIQNLVSGKVIDTHVNQLRPFNYDPERTRPVDIARQTAQEFLIGDILAHRGDRNHRSTMEFLVRWEDFTGADSWEVLEGSYLVSKSLTSLCLLTTVYNWHHISTSIYAYMISIWFPISRREGTVILYVL